MSVREGHSCSGELVTHPPSVLRHHSGCSKAQLAASTYKHALVCLLWKSAAAVPSPPHIPRWAASCSVFPYLSPGRSSTLQRALYLYHPGSLAVYIIAIYNQLIHLWPFHFALIKLLYWSAASRHISLTRGQTLTASSKGLKAPPRHRPVYTSQMVALL